VSAKFQNRECIQIISLLLRSVPGNDPNRNIISYFAGETKKGNISSTSGMIFNHLAKTLDPSKLYRTVIINFRNKYDLKVLQKKGPWSQLNNPFVTWQADHIE
jgi:hypothetical protein